MSGGVFWDLIARDSASPAMNKVAASADRAAAATARMDKSLSGVAARSGVYGAKLTKRLTLPIAAAATVSVVEAARYQKSLALIQTAGGETAKKTAAIGKGMLKTAGQTGTSLHDLSDGIYTVAKAGSKKWSATQQLGVLKAAAQGAKAENVDLGTAVGALTSVMQGYGLSAGKAVSAENEIIRASGLSKTSMQDFAGSLSNVIPLASALHVSFAQVGGAIATMTAHGESAQRSTENLNNLIRNLGGSNNVAVQAMSQLGLRSQDVARALGRSGPNGGLSGALGMVEGAMSKSSRGGMIVIGAFKRAQNATADLGTELAHMPPHLQAISKQFESGKLGYADYNAAVKSMGGNQYVLGKNFIATMNTAKGFSNALKSGNPQVQTAAQAFQKLLGGATGANAALMLSGASAKTFKSDTNQIADAANHAGKNVLGWSETSSTLSFKLDAAKASAQALAVEGGDALLPMLTKITTFGTKAFAWVDNLNHGKKEMLGWGLAGVAAIGPVLSIGSRLVKMYGVVNTVVGRLAGVYTTTGVAATTASASESRAAAVWATSEANKARATAASAAEIATSLEGTDSVLAAQARQAAVDADAYATALEGEATAARAVAAQITAIQSGLATDTAAYAASMRGSLASVSGAYGAEGAAAGTAAGRVGAANVVAGESSVAAGGAGVAGSRVLAGGGAVGAGAIGARSVAGGGAAAGLASPANAAMLGALVEYLGYQDTKKQTGSKLAGGLFGNLDAMAKGGPGGFVGHYLGGKAASFFGLSHDDDKKSSKKQQPVAPDVRALKNFVANGANATRVERAFAKAIEQDGPKYKGNQRAVAGMATAQFGIARSARQAGLTQTDLKNAITGSGSAYARVVAAWKQGANPTNQQIQGLAKLRREYHAGSRDATTFAYSHNLLSGATGKTARLIDVLKGNVENYDTTNMTARQGAAGFAARLQSLTSSVRLNGRSLKTNSLFGQRNIVAMKNAAGAAIAHAQAVYRQTGSLKKADTALLADRRSLIKTAESAGLSSKAATTLANDILGIPSRHISKIDVSTTAGDTRIAKFQREINSIIQGKVPGVSANTHDGERRIAYLQSRINDLRGKTVTIPISVVVRGAGRKLADLPGGRTLLLDPNGNPKVGGAAGGGSVPDGITAVGEGGPGARPELLLKRGSRVDVMSHPKAKKFVAETGIRAPGFNAPIPGFARGTDRIGNTQAWLRGVDSHPYVFGGTGPGGYDCSGLVGAAYSHLMGRDSHRRLFSTSNEGSVLPGLGFKHGSGPSNSTMIVGWENDARMHHTSGMVGGLKFEARDQAEGILVGSRAKDPRSFPHVMHLAGTGGDPQTAGGGGAGNPRERAIGGIAGTLRALGIRNAGSIGGVLGNAFVESHLNPLAWNKRENAHGYFQWEKGRLKALQAFARRHHESYKSDRAQRGYLAYELTHGYKNVLNYLRHPHSAAAAAAYFDKHFEGSSGSTRKQREAAAQHFAKYGRLSASELSMLGLSGTQRRSREIRAHLAGRDVRAISKALRGTVSDMQAAFKQLFGDAKSAGAPGSVLSMINGVESRVVTAQKTLITDKARLASMKAYGGSVGDTLRGAFDPTQFGSTTDLISGLTGATGTNRQYASELRKLYGESKRPGDVGLRHLTNLLAQSGQTASLQALASGSAGQARAAGRAYDTYAKSISTGSDAAIVTKFGQSTDQMVDAIHDLTGDLRGAFAAVARLSLAEGKAAREHAEKEVRAQLKRLERQVRQQQRHGR